MGHPSGRRCLRGWPTPFILLRPWCLSIPVLWLVLAGLQIQTVAAENIYEQDVEFFRSIDGNPVRCMGKIKYTMGKNTAGTLDKFECRPARERNIPLSSASMSLSGDFSCDKVKPAPWWPPSWDSLVPGCRNGGSSSSSSSSISSLCGYSSTANCLCSPLSSSSTSSSSSFSSSHSGGSSYSGSSSSHECLCVSLSSSSYSSMSAISSSSSASQCICSSLSSSLSSSMGCSVSSSLARSRSSSSSCSSNNFPSSSSELDCICSSLGSSSSMSVSSSSSSSSSHECLCSSSSIYSSISSSRSSSCSSQPNCICSSISSSSMSISSSSSSSSSFRYSSCSRQLDCICSSTSSSYSSSACSSSSSYSSSSSQIATRRRTTGHRTLGTGPLKGVERPTTLLSRSTNTTATTTITTTTTTRTLRENCRDINLSTDRFIAEVRSPNYPSTYPPNFYCAFNITAPVGKKVVIFFKVLRIEYRQSCTSDHIKLTHLEGHFGIKMCGTRLPPPWMKLISRENFITVEFKSNHAVNARGFKMQAFIN